MPTWVWLAAVSVLAEFGVLAMWFHEYRRALRWENAARVAEHDARLWRSIAEREYGSAHVHSKRTVVAPQYHSPRG